MMKKLIILIPFICYINYGWAQDSNFLDDLSYYIENTAVFEQGQEEGRAFYIPDQSVKLNGNWKFLYCDSPEGIPSGFYKSDFDDSGWDRIPVPSNWEMLGYGDRMFRNISLGYEFARSEAGKAETGEFTVVPPEVPDEYNPTGAYRKSFNLPADWNNKEVFLHFEKVSSASFVWINGKEVGYNEGAHEPSEYNITPYLQAGQNNIAVCVLKFSDGYYLEGQDYWRFAGIFDDVWIYASPKVRIFDWQVITDFDQKYSDSELSINVDIKNYGKRADGFLLKASLERNGRKVANFGSSGFNVNTGTKTVTLSKLIEKPEKWNPSNPSLYDLRIVLYNEAGKAVDQIQTRIGFRKSEIIGNVFYLNGVPVKLNGTNTHMQHPTLGHVVDEATIRKDMEILKQFNFNLVRISHYPPTHKYLELADQYGLFIVNEVGDEAHATTYVSEMPAFREMYKDRTRKVVLRDRNHPSILFWSAGNESGNGENIAEVIKEGKRLDPTRYWMYGGNEMMHPAEDIIGPRYPSPLQLEVNVGLDSSDSRPSFMDEYISVTGNGGGGLDEYWRVIYRHPRIMGGAIWDFVSNGLMDTVRIIHDRSPNETPIHIMGNAKLVDAINGKALDLNGHDQWVEVYRSDKVEISGDHLSVIMDVFPRKLNKSGGSFLTKGNNQFGLVQVGRDSLNFYIFTDKKYTLSAPLPEKWENNWHHIAAVYDGLQMKLHIDLKEVASLRVSGAIKNFPFPINIGRDAEIHSQDTRVYVCDSQIDNVRIFTEAKSITKDMRPSDAVLWLDFEEEMKGGTFYSNGMGARTYGSIWPDRSPQPEIWQMKKSAQPLTFTLLNGEKGVVEAWNRSNFTPSSYWETNWTLTEDEKVLQEGVLEINIGPGDRAKVTIPFMKPVIIPGKEYRLNISSVLKEDEIWASKGHEVSWDQFELDKWNIPVAPLLQSEAKASLDTDQADYVISGEEFTYRFNRTTGELSSLLVKGVELLSSPLKLNVWRAPICNQNDRWAARSFRNNTWEPGYGSTMATDWYSNGVDQLRYLPLEVRANESGGVVTVYVREIALTNQHQENITSLDYLIEGGLSGKMGGFESIFVYTVSGKGLVEITHTILPQGNMPQMLPRMGVTLKLNKDFHQIEWYGRGPQENYPDRKSGYRLGVYKSTVEDMYEPYLIPQDYGLRTDNRYLKMTDNEGRGLEFTMDKLFNFNVYPYSTENLTKAVYTFQLKKADRITLNLDYESSGVGDTSQPVLNSYRVYPHGYKRHIIIKPVNF